jgi:8'-apo-carotenoid 13,14-cleaving dioxygenase
MTPPSDPSFLRSNRLKVGDETTITGLNVNGILPAGLSGRLFAIGPDTDRPHDRSLNEGDGVIHCAYLHAGRTISYRSRWVITDDVAQRRSLTLPPGPRNAGADIVAGNIIEFGGSILALGHGSLAYELTPDLETLRRVDLAGQFRGLAAYPKRDPLTGDLHLLADNDTGTQEHVVVSPRAFTRTSRTIAGAPNPIEGLAITADHVVFAADEFVGVVSRNGEATPTWIATAVRAPYLVHAFDAGDEVIVYTTTPSLERWTLQASSAIVHREILDPAPQRFVRTRDQPAAGPPRFLWATDDRATVKHDLLAATRERHTFPAHRTPGDLVFVGDVFRPNAGDGGWLVGFVHHTTGDETDLVVLDAADIAAPTIATVTIPRGVPHVHRSTWIPSTQATEVSQDST